MWYMTLVDKLDFQTRPRLGLAFDVRVNEFNLTNKKNKQKSSLTFSYIS